MASGLKSKAEMMECGHREPEQGSSPKAVKSGSHPLLCATGKSAQLHQGRASFSPRKLPSGAANRAQKRKVTHRKDTYKDQGNVGKQTHVEKVLEHITLPGHGPPSSTYDG